MKKTVALILTLILTFSMSGCGSEKTDVSASGEVTGQEETKKKSKNNGDEVQIPDLSGCDEDSAKTLLVNLGLVPVIAEEYSDDIESGYVVRCEPECLTEISTGTKVTVYISAGASYIQSKNASFTFTSQLFPAQVGTEAGFVSDPYISENTLVLDLWYEAGWVFTWCTTATVTIDGKTFAAEVYSEQSKTPVEGVFYFTIYVPLNEINNEEPTSLSAVCSISDGNTHNLEFDFSIQW